MASRRAAADLDARLGAAEATARLVAAQRRLLHLRLLAAGLLDPLVTGPAVCVVFEGFDASGKGGAIRRLAASFDPRHVLVVETGPPTNDELAHHFLWRFAAALPPRGGLTVFDRSWYGRLLVERVEHLISADELARSTRQIVEFERALTEEGTVLVKLWLEVSAAEQLRRFEARRDDPLKRWKLTDDDWHNRSLRASYEAAIDDAIAATSTAGAPWDVIAAEHKPTARVEVLETVIARIEAGLAAAGIEVPPSRGADYGA